MAPIYQGFGFRLLVISATLVAAVSYLWPTSIWAKMFAAKQTPFSFDPDIPRFNGTDQSRACIQLAEALPDSVFSRQHPFFEYSNKQAFTIQAREEVPCCIVKPSDSHQLSTAVKVLKVEYDAKRDARFAVRSGGHYTGPGQSSIKAGVLIDMSAFDEVSVHDDRKHTTLGVGSRWGRVYKELDSVGLRVAGGRDAGVGVGGLVLGGGISHLSPRVGMVCDNIVEYEIVLADGSIKTVSETRHPDLWRSLKGGSSNFGIVTRVVANTFPGGKIWGGYKYWAPGQNRKILDTFFDFVAHGTQDENAASPFITYGYTQKLGSTGMAGFFAYNTLNFEGKWPPAFKQFQKLWSIWGGVGPRKVSDLAVELHAQSIEDIRQHYATKTIKNNRQVLQQLPAIFDKYIPQLKTIPKNVITFIVQPLPATITHKGSPNVLGLESRDPKEPTPIVVLVASEYFTAEHDELVRNVSRSMLEDIEQYAVERGSGDSYLYLNYADNAWQDPIASYGPANQKFMQDVSRKFDPDGFFQVALEGGFKLGMY